MIQAFKPSLEEAKILTDQTEALDFIAKRGNAVGVRKEDRIK